MRITADIDYAASPDTVFAMLSDEEFQRRKCEATGSLESTVSITVQGDRTRIETTRAMPTDSFPDFVKGMVGATLTIHQTDDWGPRGADGSRQGRLTAVVGSAPLGVTGSLSLGPGRSGSGGSDTVEHIECDLKARVPLIGGRIESAAAPALQAGIAVERRTGQAWLGEH